MAIGDFQKPRLGEAPAGVVAWASAFVVQRLGPTRPASPDFDLVCYRLGSLALQRLGA